jgi:hypothetical protein
MSEFLFLPATRTGVHARIALMGPPGGGKTYTALTVAQAFGGTTGVIDTERRRAEEYAHLFDFRTLPMRRYNPADLTKACAAAADQEINNLIVDSWSHFWAGTDGMREQVDKATAAAGRSDKFGSGWNVMAPIEQAMLDALCGYPGNVIVTMRTKVEYVTELNPRTGKVEPKPVGTKAVQRDGSEYEFSFVGYMADAVLTMTKSPCPELASGTVITKPDEEFARTIDRWLNLEAYGEPLNPLTVRDWAMAPVRTRDELKVKYDELDASGAAGTAINAPNGSTWALGEWVRECARVVKRREEKQAAIDARPVAVLGDAVVGAAG